MMSPERQRARELKTEKKRTLKQIAEILFNEGFSSTPRSLTWVHHAIMTLEKRIDHLFIEGYSINDITLKLKKEGYSTRRSKEPTKSCVRHYLKKNGRLK